MPLALRPPRPGKTPNWEIRGTYLGVRVERSAGTPKRELADRLRRKIEREIEEGKFSADPPGKKEKSFAQAVIDYVKTGHSKRYLDTLVRHFGETPLPEIDQDAIDAAASSLYPGTSPATRSRCVYDPISAVFRHAGHPYPIRRPKGYKGKPRNEFLTPADAALIIGKAEAVDAELALLLRYLLYTGNRINEALRLTWDRVRLDEGMAWIGITKNGDPRTVKLRTELCAALEAHRAGRTSGKVFRFSYGGHAKDLLLRAKLSACGLPMPARPKKGTRGNRRRLPPYRLSWVTFHSFRHTWASWMRIYGGLDSQGLVATGNWRDRRSAERYSHVVARAEWERVESLPSIDENGQ